MLLLLLLPQEIQPSGPNGPTVSVGAYVRDLLVEQVSSWGARGERGVLGCWPAAVSSTRGPQVWLGKRLASTGWQQQAVTAYAPSVGVR